MKVTISGATPRLPDDLHPSGLGPGLVSAGQNHLGASPGQVSGHSSAYPSIGPRHHGHLALEPHGVHVGDPLEPGQQPSDAGDHSEKKAEAGEATIQRQESTAASSNI